MDYEYQTSTEEQVREGIVELYLNVKIRSTEEIANFCDDQMDDERDRLYKIDSLEILDYVKSSVEILMNMKGEEIESYQKNKEIMDRLKRKEEEKRITKLKEEKENLLRKVGRVRDDQSLSINDSPIKHQNQASNNNNGRNANRFILETSLYSSQSLANLENNNSQKSIPASYEKMIIKLEGDIRNHIRVEQQLKLHIESIQAQLEELQKQNEDKQDHEITEVSTLKQIMQEQEKQIIKLQLDIQEKDKPLKEKTSIIQKLEEKLKNLESKYQEEIQTLKQEILNYQVMEQQKINEDKIRQLQIDLNQIPGGSLGFGIDQGNNQAYGRQNVSHLNNNSNLSGLRGQSSFGFNTRTQNGITSGGTQSFNQNDLTQASGRKYQLQQDTFRSNQQHNNNPTLVNRSSLDNFSSNHPNNQNGSLFNYGSNVTTRFHNHHKSNQNNNYNDLINKTPSASQQNDLSNLDYMSTGNVQNQINGASGFNSAGNQVLETPASANLITDFYNQSTTNKDAKNLSSMTKKNFEKSKLIQSCLLRGNSLNKKEHRRSQSTTSENNYPSNQPQILGGQTISSGTGASGAQNNNKIIINQQHYFTDSIKIYQNNGTEVGANIGINSKFQPQITQSNNISSLPMPTAASTNQFVPSQLIQANNFTQPQTSRQNSMESANKRAGKVKKRQIKSKQQAQTLFTQSVAFQNQQQSSINNGIQGYDQHNILNKLVAQQPLSSQRYISAKRGAAQTSLGFTNSSGVSIGAGNGSLGGHQSTKNFIMIQQQLQNQQVRLGTAAPGGFTTNNQDQLQHLFPQNQTDQVNFSNKKAKNSHMSLSVSKNLYRSGASRGNQTTIGSGNSVNIANVFQQHNQTSSTNGFAKISQTQANSLTSTPSKYKANKQNNMIMRLAQQKIMQMQIQQQNNVDTS
eukprot:403330954